MVRKNPASELTDLHFDLHVLKKYGYFSQFHLIISDLQQIKKIPKALYFQGFGDCLLGDPAGIRTPDPLLKRQLLCRLSYRIIYQTPPGGK